MNLRLLARILGIITLLIGATMLFSLPWANPAWGFRRGLDLPQVGFETRGFLALVFSMIICMLLGWLFIWLGRDADNAFFRKEAMAVVGLSWTLATVLGALPYLLSNTYRCAGLRLGSVEDAPLVYAFGEWRWQRWRLKQQLDENTFEVLSRLMDAGARGLPPEKLPKFETEPSAVRIIQGLERDPHWDRLLLVPGDAGPQDRRDRYRLRWVAFSICDALFESQSGFSTTGATVISDLEDPYLIPHCILFWRSSTHFLGGLGIVVLFVAILGQGSAGKALMRAEMPGPTKEGTQTRMQQTAWFFAAIYCGLNLVLTLVLLGFGLSCFDALCHAFGTMATGGFSTYNASLGHFDSAGIDYVVILFMMLAGSNFSLIYQLLILRPLSLWNDLEWRVYMTLIIGVTSAIVLLSWTNTTFLSNEQDGWWNHLSSSVRYALFQVVSILTTTGYGTHDFDTWNHFARGLLLSLMFVGGCAGSTGGGMKVIRHVLLVKILRLEVEQAYHPSVVRPLRLGGRPVDDPNLNKNILVYFSLFLVIFIGSWLLLITVESDITWGSSTDHKLIDSASAIAATFNNIGPGLGTIGATENYAHFSNFAKLLFTWLMMLGRVEIFAIFVLFFPSFWSSH